MCEEFHGTFRQGIELNNLRMSEQIPSIQEQIDKEYQPFSIIANLILPIAGPETSTIPPAIRGIIWIPFPIVPIFWIRQWNRKKALTGCWFPMRS